MLIVSNNENKQSILSVFAARVGGYPSSSAQFVAPNPDNRNTGIGPDETKSDNPAPRWWVVQCRWSSGWSSGWSCVGGPCVGGPCVGGPCVGGPCGGGPPPNDPAL